MKGVVNNDWGGVCKLSICIFKSEESEPGATVAPEAHLEALADGPDSTATVSSKTVEYIFLSTQPDCEDIKGAETSVVLP